MMLWTGGDLIMSDSFRTWRSEIPYEPDTSLGWTEVGVRRGGGDSPLEVIWAYSNRPPSRTTITKAWKDPGRWKIDP